MVIAATRAEIIPLYILSEYVTINRRMSSKVDEKVMTRFLPVNCLIK